MNLEVYTIYITKLTSGREFCAKLIELSDGIAVFEARNGIISQHPMETIYSVRKVVG